MDRILLANKLGALVTALQDNLDHAVDVNATHHAILATLLHRGPMGSTDMAVILERSQPAVTRAIESLRKSGLVNDQSVTGRNRPVGLTAAGAKVAKSAAEARFGVLAGAFVEVSDEECSVFDRVIDGALRQITQSREHARCICRFCDHSICDGPNCPVGTRARQLEARG